MHACAGADHQQRTAHFPRFVDLARGLDRGQRGEAAGVEQPHRGSAGGQHALFVGAVAGLGDGRVQRHDLLGLGHFECGHGLAQRVLAAVVGRVLVQRQQGQVGAARRVLRQRQDGPRRQFTRLGLALQRQAVERRAQRHHQHQASQCAQAPARAAGAGQVLLLGGGAEVQKRLHRVEAGLAVGLIAAGVESHPCCVGLLELLPLTSPRQVAASPQLAVAIGMGPGIGLQAVQLGSGLTLGRHPLAQTRPLAHQAFVRDVDHRIAVERHLNARQQERGVGTAVALKYLAHGGVSAVGGGRIRARAHRHQVSERHGPAQLDAVRRTFGQCPKHPLDRATGRPQRSQ